MLLPPEDEDRGGGAVDDCDGAAVAGMLLGTYSAGEQLGGWLVGCKNTSGDGTVDGDGIGTLDEIGVDEGLVFELP